MGTRACVQCGRELDESAKFCGSCGAIVEENRLAPPPAKRTLLAIQPTTGATGPAPGAVSASKRTIVGLPSLAGDAPGLTTAPPAGGVPLITTPFNNAPAPKQTIVGIAPPIPPAERGGPPSPAGSFTGGPMRRTMVGVAMPGIAPTHDGVDGGGTTLAAVGGPPLHQTAPHAASRPPAPRPDRPMSETMPMPAFFVPPPAPLPEFQAPPKIPAPPRRSGAPLFVAALIAGAVALVGGSAIAFFWRGTSPIAAQPRIAPDGKDLLHLQCETRSCADGTTVALDGAKASFLAGEADLPLATPLHVGDNVLSLAIDRPGMGRDETVKLVVPVAYRVRADVTTMDSPHPAISIRVEAPPGTDVRVEEKPVALDAKGMGAYVIDESAATEGPADESRVIAVEVPYVVVPTGHAAERGTVSARIAVAPLRVDAPGPTTTIDGDSILIAGRAARGATATINGSPVQVAPEGSFETTVPVSTQGEHTIEVRAGTAVLSPRLVRLSVTRVDSLASAAKAFEAQPTIGYDQAMRDIASAKTGEKIVVEGEVVEARASGHSSVVLVDDRRGCDKGPCVVRVIVGQTMSLARGETLRAYGRVARAYRTPSAQTVPEVEAEFVLRANP